ncbi:MAG TPA: hypothetical protein VNP73_00060, partial [Actinomycetota bacterium]|nr:hypothetical protein [Actinomycetota bacterium]
AITNNTGTRYSGTFASEASVMPLNLGRETQEFSVEVAPSGWRVTQEEAEVSLEVEVDKEPSLTHEPIATASATLEGLKAMAQGVCVTMSWDLELDAGDTFLVETRWRLRVGDVALTKRSRGVSAAL